jgi:inorganic pyrophosphatase
MSFEVDVIVEIPHGSIYKYEVDKTTGTLVIDRPLRKKLPYNYGYVPNTLHEDGDPLDVCILSNNPIYPLTKVKVNIVGALKCKDNGFSDDKLLAIVVGDAPNLYYGGFFTEEALTQEIIDYLSTYKEGFVVESQLSSKEAYQILMHDIQAYQNE